MLRWVFSIVIIFALTGGSAASLIHGLNHSDERGAHHADMSQNDVASDAEMAQADCCDAAGGPGSPACFGDLVATVTALADTSGKTKAMVLARLHPDVWDLSPGVPTGPPKV